VGTRRPVTAETVWSDLIAGRLAVLKLRDENGRRYLHVQARDTSEAGAALSERELLVIRYRAYAQGLKLIAFELGVSVPTVARCLASALGKLQLRSDMDLPAVFGTGMRLRG
jgi:DNA-binding NarL/FixJ family response regulator